jgi:hypothetical protein
VNNRTQIENSLRKAVYICVLEELATAAAGLGSINSTPDQGGIIRRTPLQFQFYGLDSSSD